MTTFHQSDEALQKELDETNEALLKTLDDNDEILLRFRRARAYRLLGDNSSAASDYLEVVGVSHECKHLVHAKCMLALIHLEIGKSESSLWWATSAMEHEPDGVEANLTIGLVLKACRFFALASENFRRVLDVEPNHRQSRVNLGRCLRESGQLDDAIRVFSELLECDARDGIAHFELGRTHHVNVRDSHRISKAIGEYDTAIRYAPDLRERIERRRASLQQLRND